jgi:hypothetical protein
MAVNGEQRRALQMLAGSPLGATEAIMLAHGFTNAMLDALVRDGLATAERRAMKAGGAAQGYLVGDHRRWAAGAHPARLHASAVCRSITRAKPNSNGSHMHSSRRCDGASDRSSAPLQFGI